MTSALGGSGRKTGVASAWDITRGTTSLYSGTTMPHRPIRPRLCSKASCSHPAKATLTYVYGDAQAVIGPLSAIAEPHTYDLCDVHATSLTAPVGWSIVRHQAYPEAI